MVFTSPMMVSVRSARVAPPEERLRKLAQPLGQADALPPALVVDDAVLVVVRVVLGDDSADGERGERNGVGQMPGSGAPVVRMVHQLLHSMNSVPTPPNTTRLDAAVHAAPTLTLRTPSSVRPYFLLQHLRSPPRDALEIFQLTACS